MVKLMVTPPHVIVPLALNSCVAIVGSRRSSTYGQNAALMLARDLAQRGVTIVSGFAAGFAAVLTPYRA